MALQPQAARMRIAWSECCQVCAVKLDWNASRWLTKFESRAHPRSPNFYSGYKLLCAHAFLHKQAFAQNKTSLVLKGPLGLKTLFCCFTPTQLSTWIILPDKLAFHVQGILTWKNIKTNCHTYNLNCSIHGKRIPCTSYCRFYFVHVLLMTVRKCQMTANDRELPVVLGHFVVWCCEPGKEICACFSDACYFHGKQRNIWDGGLDTLPSAADENIPYWIKAAVKKLLFQLQKPALSSIQIRSRI